MRIRDVLGQVYADEAFVGAFGVRGRPGTSPAQLMTATVLQFSEDLTDRQAAESVRTGSPGSTPWVWNWTIRGSTPLC